MYRNFVRPLLILLLSSIGMAIFLAFVFDENVSYGDLKPDILDSNLKLEPVTKGLNAPTAMAFIGPDDMLVLEKDNGKVERITNGHEATEPVLDVDVSFAHERGMLGIATAKNETNNSNQYVFLFYTKSETNRDENIYNSKYRVSNYLYRYDLVNNSILQNPKLIMSTPSTENPFHLGGKLVMGPDHYIYLTTGDQINVKATQAQNVKNGAFPDKTSGILRFSLDGQAPSDNILGKKYPLNLYYAYGIRNSFGIDFDPVTGKLWDTELGPAFGDEINLVEPGFNSGWSTVQGIWAPSDKIGRYDLTIRSRQLYPENLVDFDGRGKYSTPEFIWKDPVCVTAIKFISSDKYGKEYEGDVFVGTSIGNLYHFDMNKNRTGFSLTDEIVDTNSPQELARIQIGDKFGAITDMQVSP